MDVFFEAKLKEDEAALLAILMKLKTPAVMGI